MVSYKVPENLLSNRHDERYYNRDDLETTCKMLELSDEAKTYLLGNILEHIGTGKGILQEEQGLGEIGYLKVGNISRYFIDYTEVEVVSEEVVERNSMEMLRNGDILISRVGTVGNVCMYRDIDMPATPSDNVLILRLNKQDYLRPFYTCIFFNSPFGQAQIRRLAKQSLQEVINQTSIKSLITPYPDVETQISIEKAVTAHLMRISKLQEEIKTEFEQAEERIGENLFNGFSNNYSQREIQELMDSLDSLTKVAWCNSSRQHT